MVCIPVDAEFFFKNRTFYIWEGGLFFDSIYYANYMQYHRETGDKSAVRATLKKAHHFCLIKKII